MSTIEQILIAVLAVVGLATVGGGAALLRLLQRNAPPPPRAPRVPLPTVEEEAAARTERERTRALSERHQQQHAERDRIVALPPDEGSRARAEDRARRGRDRGRP